MKKGTDKPKLKKMTIMVPEELWAGVKKRSVDERTSITDIIIRLLTSYLKRKASEGEK